MSPKRIPKGVKQNSSADLRAMAEARLGSQGPKSKAARRADAIRAGLTSYSATMTQIAEAYRDEDWKALGYESFHAYAAGEFGEERLRLSPEHRAQILPAFVAVGMPKRAMAAALGVDDKTIRNDLRGADNSAPAKKLPQVSDPQTTESDAEGVSAGLGAQSAADVDKSSAGGEPGDALGTPPASPSGSSPAPGPVSETPQASDGAPDGVPQGSGDGPGVTPEHAHGGGTSGGPGENEAWCVCGVEYAGYDTHKEASAAVDRHIAVESSTVDSPAGQPSPSDAGEVPLVATDRLGFNVAGAPVRDTGSADPEEPYTESDSSEVEAVGVCRTDASGVAGDGMLGGSPVTGHIPGADPIEQWAAELADVIERRPAPAAAALADLHIQDVLYEAMADLDDWQRDLTHERTLARLAEPRADATT